METKMVATNTSMVPIEATAPGTAKITSELATIADSVKAHHSQAVALATSALENAKLAGELLTQAKSLLPHGQWLSWLSENCQVSDRQAQRYMKVSANWGAITKNDATSYLTIDEALSAVSVPSLSATYDEDCSSTFTTTDYRDTDVSPQRATKPHVAHNSGDNEWYTPKEFIDAARIAMGGIDCDPASSEVAQETVGATEYFTKDSDGLSKGWSGDVWLNPPYAQPLISQFAAKLLVEIDADNVHQAVVLVNNGTETKWFQGNAVRSSAVCFPSSRVKFLEPDGKPGAPLQGQAILYFGNSPERCVEAFQQFGWSHCT